MNDLELNRLYKEVDKEIQEMNLSDTYHCNRCHAVLKSDNFIVRKDRRIEYLAPTRCIYCKDEEYFMSVDTKQGLATETNGLLCQCTDPECMKQTYIKPSFYLKQQAIKRQDLKELMPVLIDPDKEKVARLLAEHSEPLNDQEESATFAHK